MCGWLYLIRNGDLYKIGITKHFDKRMRQLKPDNVVAKLYTSDYKLLERELHNRYKKYRIPQTEYFRLKTIHLKEIKQRISNLDFNISINFLILIKSFLLLMIIFIFITMYISLTINNIYIVILKSILLMERISCSLSFLSLFLRSGKYYGFFNELKYRSIRFIVLNLFTFIFRLTYLLLN